MQRFPPSVFEKPSAWTVRTRDLCPSPSGRKGPEKLTPIYNPPGIVTALTSKLHRMPCVFRRRPLLPVICCF